MRPSTLVSGLALAVVLLAVPAASASVSLDEATDPIHHRLNASQDALEALFPGPIHASETSALDASLPGEGSPLTLQDSLLTQPPSVPRLSATVSTPLDSSTPSLDSGQGYVVEATQRAHGPVQPADESLDRSADLPDHVLSDGTEGADDADGSNVASTQSTPQRSANAGSDLAKAWKNLDDGEKAAVAAGALGLMVVGPLSLYSRIKRDDALENDTRREIYEIVEANPGICIQDAADQADVSYSTASYHLKRLVRMDYVTRREDGNKVLYYKNGGTFTETERELVPVLQNEEAMRVFRYIVENPWCYRAQVAEALGVSHTTVNWHLDRLQEVDLVDEHREGRSCHLHVDETSLDRVTSVIDKLDDLETVEQTPTAPVAAA